MPALLDLQWNIVSRADVPVGWTHAKYVHHDGYKALDHAWSILNLQCNTASEVCEVIALDYCIHPRAIRRKYTRNYIMSGNGKRIVFTGGSGKAGRHCIPYLLKQGYQVLNVDLADFPDKDAGVFTLKADLTDSGQCFNALTSHYNFKGYEGPSNASPPDAVIHFAAYARNMLVPVRLDSHFQFRLIADHTDQVHEINLNIC